MVRVGLADDTSPTSPKNNILTPSPVEPIDCRFPFVVFVFNRSELNSAWDKIYKIAGRLERERMGF